MDAIDPRSAFLAMFEAVRGYLLSQGRQDSIHERAATNAKGEASYVFDREAERIAVEVAHRHLGDIHVLSEEGGELQLGHTPRWMLILDPCDGSDNFRRGIRAVGFAVAALPFGATLDPGHVEYALCGDIWTGSVYTAARGCGATRDGHPCHASSLRSPRFMALGMDTDHGWPPDESGAAAGPELAAAQRLTHLLATAAAVRRAGATVIDLCYVADGAYDAYVDVRGRLTPENFLAPALIIAEAGGRLSNEQGHPLGDVDFTTPYSVLAAGNDDLLAELVGLLHEP